MKAGALPIWVYMVAALAIALIAFGLGQLAEGLGAPFVILASSLWMMWSVRRQRGWLKKNG